MSYDVEVTHLLENAYTLSGSVAEWGEGAGRFTWNNCLKQAEKGNPITDDNRDEVRSFFRSFGAWSAEEIGGWDDAELGALLIQFAAGDIREAENVATDDDTGEIDWDEYEREAERGQVSGRLFRDAAGRIWFNFAN
jgi:hypothetical protein